MARLLLPLVALLLVLPDARAALKKPPTQPQSQPSAPKEVEPVIEEVTAKQLERVLNEKDFVAVYWCKSLRSALLTRLAHRRTVLRKNIYE